MPALKDFRVYTRTLAANGEETIDASGRFLAVLSATGTFELGVGGEPFTEFLSGLKAVLPDGEEFTKLRLRDTSGASNTIQVAIGFGDFQDARLSLSGSITLSKGTNLVSTADVSLTATTTTQIIASNGTRREVVLRNLVSNTQTFRIGESAAAAARGIPLAPGETLRLPTSAAVHGYNPGGAAESVAVVEIRD